MIQVYTSSEGAFECLKRVTRGSIAHPAGFAVPVDAAETEEAVHVTFLVPASERDGVQVIAGRDSVLVTAPRSTRICRLPCEVVESSLSVLQHGNLLTVSLSKKRPAAASLGDATLQAA